MGNNLVHLRLGDKLIKEIDFIVKKSTFENRSEFIKEALRKEIEENRKKELVESLRKNLGMAKRMGIKEPTEEEFEKIREKVAKSILKKKGFL